MSDVAILPDGCINRVFVIGCNDGWSFTCYGRPTSFFGVSALLLEAWAQFHVIIECAPVSLPNDGRDLHGGVLWAFRMDMHAEGFCTYGVPVARMVTADDIRDLQRRLSDEPDVMDACEPGRPYWLPMTGGVPCSPTE